MKRKLRICLLILTAMGAGVLFIYVTGCKKTCCTIGFVLATDTVSAITESTAKCGGTISSDDEDPVTARGVCWSTRQSPTVEDDTSSDGVGKGHFISSIHSLASNTRYYVRAYVTNRKGSAYGDEKSFKTNIAPVFTIGISYGGGVIFYIDSTGVHGLIAATTDQVNKAEWGCSGTPIPGADSTTVGSGKENTDAINYGCNQPDIAARICTGFISSNYTGWFLPSKDELDSLFKKKDVVGGFASEYYWSSTQVDKDSAWGENLTTGVQKKILKSAPAFVRPVRAF